MRELTVLACEQARKWGMIGRKEKLSSKMLRKWMLGGLVDFHSIKALREPAFRGPQSMAG